MPGLSQRLNGKYSLYGQFCHPGNLYSAAQPVIFSPSQQSPNLPITIKTRLRGRFTIHNGFIFHKCHNIDNSGSLVLGWNCFLDTSTGSRGGGGVGGEGQGGGGGQGIDPCEEGPGHSGARTLTNGTQEGSEGGQDAPGEAAFQL